LERFVRRLRLKCVGVLRLRIALARDASLRMTGSIGLRLMLVRNGLKPARRHHFPFDVTA
jgi:hypothetical protein